ncbi:MAG: spore maturation protein [Rhodospirillales bacterium]|nr:spore maturation protein [Rhodospirillales bacterium]
MNSIIVAVIVAAFGFAATRQLFDPAAGSVMQALSKTIVDDAGQAVTLAFGLIGVLALFLGVMKVAEAAGLLRLLARLLRRPMQRLFPQVPADHPAMGSMILNIAANILGLGNAATPFGLKAMQALDQLNPRKGEATDAMVLFMAINTASVTVLPTSVIALRAAAGSTDPAGITLTTLFATTCSTIVAVVAAKLGQRYWPGPVTPTTKTRPMTGHSAEVAGGGGMPLDVKPPAPVRSSPSFSAVPDSWRDDQSAAPTWVSVLFLLGFAATFPLLFAYGQQIGGWLLPTLIAAFVVYGACRRVAVYEALVEGAREGFDVAVRILPYLVIILVAIGMLRASGALPALLGFFSPLTTALGIPVEAVLMAILRTLSGSGAFAYLASVINDPAIGPDSYTGYLVSTIQGSTETTFYVLAVYCGAAGVRRIRYALVAGLAADATGFAAAVLICRLLYGG